MGWLVVCGVARARPGGGRRCGVLCAGCAVRGYGGVARLVSVLRRRRRVFGGRPAADRPDRRQSPHPQQAGQWVRLVMAAQAQLLLARPHAADLRRPMGNPAPGRPPAHPGQVRRGFANIRGLLGTPAHVAKPAKPGPGRPKGSASGPAPPVQSRRKTTPRTNRAHRRKSKVKTQAKLVI